MGMFYKADRMRTVLSTPDTPESSFDFVSELRATHENDEAISCVLEKFSHLTASQIHDSLMEVASVPDTAFISLKAAMHIGEMDVARHAAGVIRAAAFLSDEVKKMTKDLMGSRVKSVTKMGLGRGARSLGDQSAKRRGS